MNNTDMYVESILDSTKKYLYNLRYLAKDDTPFLKKINLLMILSIVNQWAPDFEISEEIKTRIQNLMRCIITEDSKMKMLKNYSDDYTNVNLPQSITTWQLSQGTEILKDSWFGRVYDEVTAYNPLLIAAYNPLLTTAFWGIPNEGDVADLHYPVEAVGNSYSNGGRFKNPSTEYWDNLGTAENLFGFDSRGGGRYTEEGFSELKFTSYFWLQGGRTFFTDFDSTYLTAITPEYSYYIRFCRPVATSESNLSNGTRVEDYVDYEGNRYICRKINNRVWMCENLRTRYLSDGTKLTTQQTHTMDNDISNVLTL